MKITIAIAAVFAIALVQSPASNAEPEPIVAKAAVPVLNYQSPFRDYRLFGDAKPIAWKDANDEVARIGGWRAYAKEATETPSAPPTAPVDKAPATASKPSVPDKPHSGHQGHGQPK